MGYVFCVGPCFGCGRVFSFNPIKVPAFKGEPVCGTCMERANAKRIELGMEPHPIHPEAYDPTDEQNLG